MIETEDSEFTQIRFTRNYDGYKTWNPTSAECFLRKMNCHNCSNAKYCNSLEWHRNPYSITNIKYAVLMTYSNIGEKGLDKYYYTSLDEN